MHPRHARPCGPQCGPLHDADRRLAISLPPSTEERPCACTPMPKPQSCLVPKGQFPCWLKLVRKGNDFEGFESTDGQKWQSSGKITLELPENTVVGLGSSSPEKDILTKCVFDHVKVTGTPGTVSASEWQCRREGQRRAGRRESRLLSDDD